MLSASLTSEFSIMSLSFASRRAPVTPLFCLGLGSLLVGTASAQTVTVTVSGSVEFNQISAPPLGNAASGDAAVLSFDIDAADFLDSTNFPTRGYAIDQSSFVLTLGGSSIGLLNPYGPGDTPFFVLRDNDPAVDGFFIANSVDFPIGVQLDQVGAFGDFENQFSVGYTGSTLESLDVLDACGAYDFTGLQVFNWTIDDGPFNAMGLEFASMTIDCSQPGATTYCQGKVNSQGCTPELQADPGLPSVSGGPWHITALDLLSGQNGLFFYGLAPANLPFMGGTLCLSSPLTRTAVQGTGGSPPPAGCSGTMALDLAGTIPAAMAPVTVYVQAWARDPADVFGVSLTNAVEVQVLP